MTGTHISLFAGVGMLDIAAEKAGYKTVATAESDAWKRMVLHARFPGVSHLEDVRLLTRTWFSLTHGTMRRPLLISGGFPCRDISPASSTGTGLAGSRSGLWSEFARVIREFRPDAVLIENSSWLRHRGLGTILTDLWGMGYKARWDCIPAASVGAPHMRDRIFIVAAPERTPDYQGGAIRFVGLDPAKLPRSGEMHFGTVTESSPYCTVTEARAAGPELLPTPTKSDGTGGPGTTPKREGGKNLRTVVNEECGNGRMNPSFLEWMMGIPDNWTNPDVPNAALKPHSDSWAFGYTGDWTVPKRSVKDRLKRIQAIGDGAVPQAAAVALSWLTELST